MWSLCEDPQYSMCPENWRCDIFFIEGIFANISMKMHSIFPDTVLISTTSIIFLISNLLFCLQSRKYKLR
jgi:hypothetical protein